MNITHSVNEQSSKLKSAAKVLGAVSIDSLEDVMKNNLESYAYYNALAIRQLRSVASVHDTESLRQCLADSISASSEIAKRMISDGQFLLSIGARFKDGLSQGDEPR